jgi:hypothetical protein
MKSPSLSVKPVRWPRLRDRLVGEPEPVEFAALEYLHDDSEQPLVGDEAVGNGAGAAQVIGGDRIGIADPARRS